MSVLSKLCSFKSHPLKARDIHDASLYPIWGDIEKDTCCKLVVGICLTFPKSSCFCKERYIHVISNQSKFLPDISLPLKR